MNNLFQRASSPWVRYSEYEYKRAENGHFYITPTAKAKPEIYDPLKDSEQMVLDALNIGALQMNRKGEAAIRDAIMDFVGRYGLLGFFNCPAYHSVLYGLCGGLFAKESVYPGRIHVYPGLFGAVLPL